MTTFNQELDKVVICTIHASKKVQKAMPRGTPLDPPCQGGVSGSSKNSRN